MTTTIATTCESPRERLLEILELGRMIQRTKHRTEALWLDGAYTNEDAKYAEASLEWSGLRLAGRRAFAIESQRIQFAAALSEAECTWNTCFKREWHHEGLYAANELIAREYERGDESLLSTIHAQCEDVLLTNSSGIRQLEKLIEDRLDEQQIEWYELGKFIETSCFPSPAYHLMEADTALSPMEVPGDIWTAVPKPVETTWRLPKFTASRENLPQEWFSELAIRLKQLGATDVTTIESPEFPSRTLENRQSFILSVIREIGCPESSPCPVTQGESDSACATEVAPANQWQPAQFELEFNDNETQVRITGCDQPITVDARLTFNVLRCFATYQNRWTTRSALVDSWCEFGGTSNGVSSIDSRLTKVRAVISSINACITERHNRYGRQLKLVCQTGQSQWRLEWTLNPLAA